MGNDDGLMWRKQRYVVSVDDVLGFMLCSAGCRMEDIDDGDDGNDSDYEP